jgi:choline-glycine betaine transporter
MADEPADPAADVADDSGDPPRWVKVSWSVAVVLAVLFALLHLAGGGLGGHLPPSP